jgi:hypothetical protein
MPSLRAGCIGAERSLLLCMWAQRVEFFRRERLVEQSAMVFVSRLVAVADE